MDLPEKRITDFIRKHHVITLATSAGNIPWTAHCFYTYIADNNWLVFTSNLSTRHAAEAIENNEVAGGIVLETSVIGKIQGIQLSGRIRRPASDEENVAKKAYLLRFPFAVLMETTLWIVDITYIKMTDNRLGFGNKLIWEKRV